jgi:putative pyoverdin transport system ATP-binding/permease protein
MRIVKFLFLQSWKILMMGVTSGIFGGLCGAGLATVIANAVTEGGARGATASAWIFLALCGGAVIGRSASALALIHLSQAATLHLRVELSKKFLATPHLKIRSIGRAECLHILTNDIMIFTQAFVSIPTALSDGILIVVCLGYMAWVSWQLFLMFAAVLTVSVVAYHFAERLPRAKVRKIREQVDVLFNNFRNLVEGSKELQLNAKRGTFFIDEIIAPEARKFRAMYVNAMAGYISLANIGTVMFYLVIGIMLFFIPAVMSFKAAVLAQFTLILLYLIGPITNLTTCLPTLAQGGAALRKIQQLDGSLSGDELLASGVNVFARPGPLQIELKQVCHQYFGSAGAEKFTLGPVDLNIVQGEIVFVVGGNGSGKTTLAMLLLGFYPPESGTLSLNGVAVSKQNLLHYREYFSAVFADYFLFVDVMVDGGDDVNARANEYLKKFAMDHKVKVVGGKFDTTDLSTGQRKRLALVSSYLENRPVYLFDEWAADQDPVFKRLFYTELLPDLKARGKTVIIITHDDAYFSYADRVIRLEDGQLRAVTQTMPDLTEQVA